MPALLYLVWVIRNGTSAHLVWLLTDQWYRWDKIRQEQQMLRWLTFKCKMTKIVLVMSLAHQSHKAYSAWWFQCVQKTMHPWTTVDMDLTTICSWWFWQTCDLQIRSRSSNLLYTARPVGRLTSSTDWKTSLKQYPSKSKCFCQIRKHIHYLSWICAKVKNSGTYITYLTYIIIIGF